MTDKDTTQAEDGTDLPDCIAAAGGETDKVVCRECSEAFDQITASHLSRHGTTVEQYREEHPEAPLQSEAAKRKAAWSEETHGPEAAAKISNKLSGERTGD